MQKEMTEDLDIIQKSGLTITLLEGDLNIIQALDDEPNDVGGLTAQELKAKFDEGPNKIKKYLNETLAPELLAEAAVEAQRAENEAGRQAAEAARATAESARVAAEAQREASAETLKAALEASVGETERGVTAAVESLEARVEAREAALERWEGYDGAADYVPGNKVSFEGSSYVNMAACTGVAPTGSTAAEQAAGAAHWLLIARRGADGTGDLTTDAADGRYIRRSGGDMAGALTVQEPAADNEAASKGYADGVAEAAKAAAKTYADGKAAGAETAAKAYADALNAAQSGALGGKVQVGSYWGTMTANGANTVVINCAGTPKAVIITGDPLQGNSNRYSILCVAVAGAVPICFEGYTGTGTVYTYGRDWSTAAYPGQFHIAAGQYYLNFSGCCYRYIVFT